MIQYSIIQGFVILILVADQCLLVLVAESVLLHSIKLWIGDVNNTDIILERRDVINWEEHWEENTNVNS